VTAYGEASVNYLNRPETAGLIRQQLPEVQLLFCLRNPVDRLYSHYNYDLQEGRQLPDFPHLARQRGSYWDENAWGSRYDVHIERYLQFFPRQQIHIFLFEDLIAQPISLLPQVYGCIGVDPQFQPPKSDEHANASRRPKRAWLHHAIVAVEKATYQMDIPSPIRRPLSAVRHWLRNRNLEAGKLPRLNAELRAELLKEYLPTTQYVEAYLSRPLPTWH
jgi:hypothetical protein